MGASEGLSIVIPYELTIMLTAVSILAIYHYSYNQAMHYDAYVHNGRGNAGYVIISRV